MKHEKKEKQDTTVFVIAIETEYPKQVLRVLDRSLVKDGYASVYILTKDIEVQELPEYRSDLNELANEISECQWFQWYRENENEN